MLNRLYIVVGVVAILLLAAAFVVPLFVPWGQYRAQIEGLATKLVGEPVEVDGGIGLTVLPQPRLRLADVRFGPAGASVAGVASVEADFSLIDLLRGRLTISRLVLDHPSVELGFDSEGRLLPAVGLLPGQQRQDVSIADAQIVGGELKLVDQRSGRTVAIEQVDGTIKLDAVGGPFAFQGTASYAGRAYAARVSASAVTADGTATVGLTVHPADDGFSLSAEGTLTPGETPAFAGTLSYRQPPRAAQPGDKPDAGQGDFVVTGKVEATPAHVLLSDYIAIPDENRPATRLTGKVEVALGANPAFNAVISGGVLAQPPRDATVEQGAEPYELLRLLREIPALPVPGLPGTVGVDVSELDLRAATLRDIHADASVGPDGWTLSQLTAQLGGVATLKLSGTVRAVKERPEFSGDVSVATPRLDALAALWRKTAPGNPLFGMPGEIDAKLALVGETLSVDSGKLTLDGETRTFSAQIGFGTTRDLHLTADLGSLDAQRSAALFALLPEPSTDAGFAASFPKGEFSIVADSLVIDGLTGRALKASGSWDGGVLVADDISAGDLGGAQFKATKLTAFGSFDRPELSGEATLSLASADAPALAVFYDAVEAPKEIRTFLAGSFPADLALRLEAPSGDGAQSLSLSGTAGPSQVQGDAQLDAGFVSALGGHLKVRFDVKSANPEAMTGQLGLGPTTLVGASGPLHLVGVVDGTIADGIETTLLLESGGESAGFSGNILISDPTAMTGNGTLKLNLGDPGPLLTFIGAGGLSPPGLAATSNVEFAQGKWVRFENIAGQSGGETFSGELAVSQTTDPPSVTGEIKAGRVDLDSLLRFVAGPAALLSSPGGIWPDGPLDAGSARRTLTGRVHLTAPALTYGGTDLVTDVAADLDWDATSTRLRNLAGTLGTGEIDLEAQLCCAGPLAGKQFSGRASLSGVDLAALLPAAAGASLKGKVDAVGQFSGTGDSPRAILSALTGEGTYTVKDFSIQGMDPQAVTDLIGLDGVLDKQPADLTTFITDRLGRAAFVSPGFSGSLSIAGGVVRSPNVSIAGEGGQLFGSGSLSLGDLKLSGDYTLSSTEVTTASPIDAASAKITATLAGTLPAPEHGFDVSGLVDAIMVEAYQKEVTRLEKLKAEADAAREKAAEEAAAEAKKAAEEAAARKAAEAAAPAAQEPSATEPMAEPAPQPAGNSSPAAPQQQGSDHPIPPLDLGLGF